MNYDDFLKQKEKIEKLSTEEQKKFYEQILEEGGTRNNIVSKMLQEKEEQD